MIRPALALLIYASLAYGQPWQWEEYQGTFWHQAAPLSMPNFNYPGDNGFGYAVANDFNGNGRDEVLYMNQPICYHDEVVASGNILDWERRNVNQPFPPSEEFVHFVQAVNLDDDATEELLLYSTDYYSPYTSFVHCYDPDAQDPPRFTERFDLLEALAYPGFPSPSMLGDFDGDEQLDGFTPTATGWQHYERVENNWTLIETLDITPFSEYNYYLAADLNGDGDIEFAAYEPGTDCNCLTGTLLDYANGQATIYSGLSDVLLFPGDYDGDGNTESFAEQVELSLPSRLVRLSAGNPYSIEEVANRWVANSPFVYSTNHDGQHRLIGILNGERFQIGSWTMVPAGYTLLWTTSRWSLIGDGSKRGSVFEGNSADIDGDDESEILYRMRAADYLGQERTIWSIGLGGLERFYANPDTLFANPRIGDIEADGVGELVTRVAAGAPTRLYFYELERVGNDYIAHQIPYMSDGLPTNMSEFTLADIDNDGHAELFINTGYWRTYFWRNGYWEEYMGILPAGIGLNLYFADFEGDGDLDVFSQNGVWLSLTPSDADDDHAGTPSSFSLSAYPNPFNARTTIAFDLPKAGHVSLKLFDLLGREVETMLELRMNAGTHTLNYDAIALPSGVYFVRLDAHDFQSTHKLLLLK